MTLDIWHTMRNWLRSISVLILGLVLGLGLGLYVGWVAWPTEFVDADPTILQEVYRRDYTLMIANAYSLNGDLAVAQRRLNDLGEGDGRAWLLSLTVDQILSGGDETEIRHLVKLATDLGLSSPAMEPYLPPGEQGDGMKS